MPPQALVIILAVSALALQAQSLPGTAPLTQGGDLAAAMVDGIHRTLDRYTAAAREERARPRMTPEEQRERLRRIIGAVDTPVPAGALLYDASTAAPALLASTPAYRVFAVRWPVFPGVEGEGLLLDPARPPAARVVAMPDADGSPEELFTRLAFRLAEHGCQVLIPVLIDRRDTWSGIEGIRMTNQPHREWIYRMAYEAGRHIIGYEVQKALAAVDWFERQGAAPIAVSGYGEGGMIALYAAALDTRIRAALVSGYFQPREELWREPVYRDVWSLVREFGEAEIAGLVAPRALVIETSPGPRISGPPPATRERANATPNGSLRAPDVAAVRAEAERARGFFTEKERLVVAPDGGGLAALVRQLKLEPKAAGKPPALRRPGFDPDTRMRRQFDQLCEHTQRVLRGAPARRAAFWAKADVSSPERWRETSAWYRNYVWDEVIGRLPAPSAPANPRTRLIYDEPNFRGYEVMLDVWPDVFAYGILLVPKDLQGGERRPAVVCQHGLEGRPTDTTDPKVDHPAYHRYAARLADEGFVVYAPQNPYIGQDRFRLIQRKAHPLKLSLFSFILGQHQRTLEWLGALPFVDPGRIGFYGLSYGGKTAVRVPPLLDGYALSICSADFNEWVWKTTSTEARYSYLVTGEYDMYEFDFANVVNYAELASLMAPRPFMVERGHQDGVAPDEWVAYEFARVRRFYDQMNLPDRTTIEFFQGPHTINGKGTFEFLRRFLK